MATQIRVDDAKAHVAASLLSLVRAAIRQAEVVQDLKDKEYAVAGIVNVRAIFELWTDAHYILLEGDPHYNAIQYRAFGLMEFRDFAGSDRAPSVVAMCNERIDRLRIASEDAVRSAEESRDWERKRKPAWFWADRSRTSMLASLGKRLGMEKTLKGLHKLFALDAHAIIVGALEVDIREEAGKEPQIDFYLRQEPREAWEINAGYSFRILGQMWESIANYLEIEK